MPTKKLPSKSKPAKPAAKATKKAVVAYPWMLRRMQAAIVHACPEDKQQGCRAALKEVGSFAESCKAAHEFGFNTAPQTLLKFIDETINAGVTHKGARAAA